MESIFALTVRAIAFIEMAIGLTTIYGLATYSIFFKSSKPHWVYVFVIASASTSSLLGGGLLMRKEWARRLLVFFSGYIVLTKILLFMNLLEFKGEIITAPPSEIKNLISLAYHVAIIIFLSKASARQEFH